MRGARIPQNKRGSNGTEPGEAGRTAGAPAGGTQKLRFTAGGRGVAVPYPHPPGWVPQPRARRPLARNEVRIQRYEAR